MRSTHNGFTTPELLSLPIPFSLFDLFLGNVDHEHADLVYSNRYSDVFFRLKFQFSTESQLPRRKQFPIFHDVEFSLGQYLETCFKARFVHLILPTLLVVPYAHERLVFELELYRNLIKELKTISEWKGLTSATPPPRAEQMYTSSKLYVSLWPDFK